MALYSIVAILLPQIVYTCINGLTWSDHDPSAIEFIRVSGALATPLAIVSFLSSQWADKAARRDVFRIVALHYALVAIVSVLILSSGGAYMWAIVLLLSAAMGFFGARVGKVF